ncbi:hypothetical protein LPJ72_004093 [Coemansia sp. Benny D160-2]|nr:hypothetical protein LPJ72_004093 [Coemansia sp. Benny D160-2]
MEVQLEPLLKYAEELLQSYSRIIVYSGDILQSLPEPREGLSTANIKPKKEESIAFLREWKHLESVFDEFLIRLNDIRTRAHEELEAARVKCLVGEDIDMTLPEAVFKLEMRLTKYKRQYAGLLRVVDGGSVGDIEEPAESPVRTDVDMEDKEGGRAPAPEETTTTAPEATEAGNPDNSELKDVEHTGSGAPDAHGASLTNATPAETSAKDTAISKTTASQAAETPGIMAVDDDYDYDDDDEDYDVVEIGSQQTEDPATSPEVNKVVEASTEEGQGDAGTNANTPMSVQSEHKTTTDTPAAMAADSEVMDVSNSPAPAPRARHDDVYVLIDADADSLFDAQSNTGNEAIGVDSNSDLDNEEMEDIFQ